MIFLYVYSAWSVSSHYVSGKEDRQNQQSHPKYILSLICFYLSTHVELLTSLNIYLPLCKFISLICKWNNEHTEPESLEELPFCHSFHTNLYKRYSIFCPFHDFPKTLHHGLSIWIPLPGVHSHVYPIYPAILILYHSPYPSWPSHPQLCILPTHKDLVISVMSTIILIFCPDFNLNVTFSLTTLKEKPLSHTKEGYLFLFCSCLCLGFQDMKHVPKVFVN